MAIAVNMSLVGPAAGFATPAALRAQASAALTVNSVCTCTEAAGPPPGLAFYRYDPASVAADTGDGNPTVRKPNDILPANPGRWHIRDWPDGSGNGVHGEFLLPVAINAAGPSALIVADGWTVACVTDVGGVRTAWLKRTVVL